MRIDNDGRVSPETFKAEIHSMPDSQLIAQDLVQQGAVHAISFLLNYGCTEENAADMLASLRENARLIREEAARRGRPQLFERDQIVFS
jgi:hypothetical protein